MRASGRWRPGRRNPRATSDTYTQRGTGDWMTLGGWWWLLVAVVWPLDMSPNPQLSLLPCRCLNGAEWVAAAINALSHLALKGPVSPESLWSGLDVTLRLGLPFYLHCL